MIKLSNLILLIICAVLWQDILASSRGNNDVTDPNTHMEDFYRQFNELSIQGQNTLHGYGTDNHPLGVTVPTRQQSRFSGLATSSSSYNNLAPILNHQYESPGMTGLRRISTQRGRADHWSTATPRPGTAAAERMLMKQLYTIAIGFFSKVGRRIRYGLPPGFASEEERGKAFLLYTEMQSAGFLTEHEYREYGVYFHLGKRSRAHPVRYLPGDFVIRENEPRGTNAGVKPVAHFSMERWMMVSVEGHNFGGDPDITNHEILMRPNMIALLLEGEVKNLHVATSWSGTFYSQPLVRH